MGREWGPSEEVTGSGWVLHQKKPGQQLRNTGARMSMIRDAKDLEDCVVGLGPRHHRQAQTTVIERPCIHKPMSKEF